MDGWLHGCVDERMDGQLSGWEVIGAYVDGCEWVGGWWNG